MSLYSHHPGPRGVAAKSPPTHPRRAVAQFNPWWNLVLVVITIRRKSHYVPGRDYWFWMDFQFGLSRYPTRACSRVPTQRLTNRPILAISKSVCKHLLLDIVDTMNGVPHAHIPSLLQWLLKLGEKSDCRTTGLGNSERGATPISAPENSC
jgi:hypothetical protein